MLSGTGCCRKEEEINTDSVIVDFLVIEMGQGDRYANGCSEHIKIRLISIPAIILADRICVLSVEIISYFYVLLNKK